jgi:16S rRNA (adenine1518-N6/adenine1519-N6)-dimethyltransferase
MAFKHKKKFGQNFLTNQSEVLGNILRVSNVSKEDSILEIGPGEGALTEMLLDKANDVTCVEIDRDLEKILRSKFEKKDNFRLIMGDVLELDIEKEIGKKVKVVANIPYYITSPIVNKLIEAREYIDEIYIMVQKEVAERICAKSGKERSVLTLSVEYFGDAEYLFTIPKEFFEPIPKVDSAFMSIKIRKNNELAEKVSEELFFRYAKAAFSNKRKNIVNNLSSMGIDKESLRKILEESKIDAKKRAEALSIDEFINLILIMEEEFNG